MEQTFKGGIPDLQRYLDTSASTSKSFCEERRPPL